MLPLESEEPCLWIPVATVDYQETTTGGCCTSWPACGLPMSSCEKQGAGLAFGLIQQGSSYVTVSSVIGNNKNSISIAVISWGLQNREKITCCSFSRLVLLIYGILTQNLLRKRSPAPSSVPPILLPVVAVQQMLFWDFLMHQMMKTKATYVNKAWETQFLLSI